MSELLHLLTNPAHWAFEVISDLAFAGVGALFARIWVKRHDRKHHGDVPVTLPMLQEMFRVQSALMDMKIDRIEARLPAECGWCGSTSCDH